MAQRKSWDELRTAREGEPGYADAYMQAEIRYQFGRAVRQAREAGGLSQATLAARLGTTQPAVARLEAGGVDPKLSTVARLAEVFGRAFHVSGKGVDAA